MFCFALGLALLNILLFLEHIIVTTCTLWVFKHDFSLNLSPVVMVCHSSVNFYLGSHLRTAATSPRISSSVLVDLIAIAFFLIHLIIFIISIIYVLGTVYVLMNVIVTVTNYVWVPGIQRVPYHSKYQVSIHRMMFGLLQISWTEERKESTSDRENTLRKPPTQVIKEVHLNV